MLAEGYKVTLEHQASHWWYRSRRDLYMRQVRRAARDLGHPGRRLALLDYGCAGGFDLPLLAQLGTAEGADVTDALAGLGGLLRAVTGLEARCVREQRWPLPAGASIVCRLRRREAGQRG